mgnify:CR=1 FL=1
MRTLQTMFMLRRLLQAALALTLWATAHVAQAGLVTLDFESFTPGGALLNAADQGYVLNDIGVGGIVTPPLFGAAPPDDSRGYGPDNEQSAPLLEIFREDGEQFFFDSFDFVSFGPSQNPQVATAVEGYIGAGLIASDIFLPAGPFGPSLTAPDVPELLPTNLAGQLVDRLVFNMGDGFLNFHSIDNISLRTERVPAPAPAALSLVLLALLGMRIARRR